MASILLTRPQDDARRTAERLRILGHAAVIAPVTTIVPTGAPCPSGPFAAVLATSAQAAPFCAQAGLLTQETFAVGERTALSLRAAGAVRVMSAAGDGPALADLVAASLPAGARLLHVAGRDRHAEPAASLAARGYDLSVWEAYAASIVPVLPEAAADALCAGTLGGVLHYSARSAQSLLALAREAGLADALLALPQVCLSPAVAEPLARAGAVRTALAARPDEDSLLDALAAALAPSPASDPAPPLAETVARSQLRTSAVSPSDPDRC
ncbi:MAG TPA: uroporphyrinogen-III synthase [Beijerinckiaceae bacterium]|jgi:uroporphyrinogen-III synthase